jgi:hypothetical protein
MLQGSWCGLNDSADPQLSPHSPGLRRLFGAVAHIKVEMPFAVFLPVAFLDYTGFLCHQAVRSSQECSMIGTSAASYRTVGVRLIAG